MSSDDQQLDQLAASFRSQHVWYPLVDPNAPDVPTPQQRAYDSEADVTGMGGGAGGAKSDLLLGLALTAHQQSIIFRRQSVDLIGLKQRGMQIVGSSDGFNQQDNVWRLPLNPPGRVLEFGHCQNLGDERKYMGRGHDLKAFDEIAHFTEAQFRFLKAWNRTTRPGQRCRVVVVGNPPMLPEEEWIIAYFAPWLDPSHPYPAEDGELRWFARINDVDVEVEDGSPFWHESDPVEPIEPESRTFIRALVGDNPHLMATGYRRTLMQLPEPLRSQLLLGKFDTQTADDPWQVIPTEWVDLAQKRWYERDLTTAGPMTQMGVDVARGGRDHTVLARRHGDWIDNLISVPGKQTPDATVTAPLILTNLRDGAPAAIDSIGVGGEVYGFLLRSGLPVVRLDSGAPSHASDKNGVMSFNNKRSQWWWQTREALDPSQLSPLALPPDRQLKADLCAVRWKRPGSQARMETKDETKKRIGRSPDKGDSVVYATAEGEPVENSVLDRQAGAQITVVRDYNVKRW